MRAAIARSACTVRKVLGAALRSTSGALGVCIVFGQGGFTGLHHRYSSAGGRAQQHDKPRRCLPHEKKQESEGGQREVTRLSDAGSPDRIVERREKHSDDRRIHTTKRRLSGGLAA